MSSDTTSPFTLGIATFRPKDRRQQLPLPSKHRRIDRIDPIDAALLVCMEMKALLEDARRNRDRLIELRQDHKLPPSK